MTELQPPGQLEAGGAAAEADGGDGGAGGRGGPGRRPDRPLMLVLAQVEDGLSSRTEPGDPGGASSGSLAEVRNQ